MVEKVERRAAAPVPEPSSPRPARPPVDDDGTATLSELFESGRHEAIAMRLMPRGEPIPPELNLWLGQIVFRVNAAAKGLDRMYPGEADDVGDLAAAFKQRYEVASKLRPAGASEPTVVRVDPSTTRASRHRRDMITELDRLLARISIKAAGPTKAKEELVQLIQRVQDELIAVRKRAPTSASPDD
jgi:hypothetical protein